MAVVAGSGDVRNLSREEKKMSDERIGPNLLANLCNDAQTQTERLLALDLRDARRERNNAIKARDAAEHELTLARRVLDAWISYRRLNDSIVESLDGMGSPEGWYARDEERHRAWGRLCEAFRAYNAARTVEMAMKAGPLTISESTGHMGSQCPETQLEVRNDAYDAAREKAERELELARPVIEAAHCAAWVSVVMPLEQQGLHIQTLVRAIRAYDAARKEGEKT
jgi:hypothetical protein